MDTAPEISPVMAQLSRYIATAKEARLPAAVVERAKLHILDTLAAVISGSRLLPGIKAAEYARLQGGLAESTVLGSDIVTNATVAALANGMAAHADETDDSHKASRSHLGCAVVPAALALAERNEVGGEAFIRAVVLGYDVGSRTTMALGVQRFYDAGHSTHSFAPLFGAAAAAGSICGLDETRVRWLLSYTAQQASGINCWRRDREHIEKAFDFGGMPARNGVAAATMVEAGFTGVDDVLSGPRNFFFAYSPDPKPEIMIEGLGSRFELLMTNIKKWTVGSPIQAALDSIESLIRGEGITPDNVAQIRVRMSDQESDTVNNRSMPDICLQHLMAVLLIDRDLTFHSAHDFERMTDPAVLTLRAKIELEADPSLERRQPVIEVVTTEGRVHTHATRAVRGTPDNPMTRAEVEAKAQDLVQPVTGTERTRALIAAIRGLERVGSMRSLRPLLSA